MKMVRKMIKDDNRGSTDVRFSDDIENFDECIPSRRADRVVETAQTKAERNGHGKPQSAVNDKLSRS